MTSRLLPLSLGLAAGLVPLHSPPSTNAATFTVTSASDASDGAGALTTLREALDSANDTAGVDTIVFAPGVTGTVALRFEFDILEGVFIVGPGSGMLTLDGGVAAQVHSIFEVRPNLVVEISGLTFSRASRAAILNEGTLTLTDCTLRDADINGPAGGVDNRATLLVERCQFLDNTARTHGGAIDNAAGASLVVRDCRFEGNRATAGEGGAIRNLGTLVVSNSEFVANNGSFDGSLFNAEGAAAIAEGCTFSGHTQSPVSNSGTLDFNGGTIRDNTLMFGQGSAAYNNAEMRITDSIIRDNVTGGSFGGLFNDRGTLTVTRCAFTGNRITGAGAGGAIYSRGDLVVKESVFTENRSENLGGAVHNRGPSGLMDGCTFSGNHATRRGGAIYNQTVLEMVNCTLTGNTTDERGAAIRNGETVDTMLKIRHCSIVGNTAGIIGGGVANLRGTVEITHTILAANLPGQLERVEDVFVSQGYNLSDTALAEFSAPGDLTGVPPLLGGLADNGGFVPTLALQSGSPARDAGNPAFSGDPATDARGFGRVAGGRVDIGAYEFGATAVMTGFRITAVALDQTTVSITVSANAPAAGLSVESSGNLKTWSPVASERIGNLFRVTRPVGDAFFRVCGP